MTGADSTSIGRGVGHGATAFVSGYVVVFVLAVLDSGPGEFRDLFSEAGSSAFDMVGWTFYNAHFVDVELSVRGQRETVNFLAEGGAATVPKIAFYAVPVVVLLTAGYRLGAAAEGGRTAAVTAGASVVAGYLPLAVAGAIVFSGTVDGNVLLGTSGTVSYDVELAGALSLAGVVYPVVLGAIGGYAGRSDGTARQAGEQPRSDRDRSVARDDARSR